MEPGGEKGWGGRFFPRGGIEDFALVKPKLRMYAEQQGQQRRAAAVACHDFFLPAVSRGQRAGFWLDLGLMRP